MNTTCYTDRWQIVIIGFIELLGTTQTSTATTNRYNLSGFNHSRYALRPLGLIRDSKHLFLPSPDSRLRQTCYINISLPSPAHGLSFFTLKLVRYSAVLVLHLNFDSLSFEIIDWCHYLQTMVWTSASTTTARGSSFNSLIANSSIFKSWSRIYLGFALYSYFEAVQGMDVAQKELLKHMCRLSLSLSLSVLKVLGFHSLLLILTPIWLSGSS